MKKLEHELEKETVILKLILEEREACALIAQSVMTDAQLSQHNQSVTVWTARNIMNAIRARGLRALKLAGEE